MFTQYTPCRNHYDELIDNGQVREHWRGLTQSLSALGPQQLRERRWELQRQLMEHGVTYNIYGQDTHRPRPWALDMLPLVMTSREWRDIEVGIAQRAELLRLVLHDLYGPQNLIRRGLLPAELVFAHAGYLLPCWDSESVIERQLTIYAADLGRAADGSPLVTEDRTQAPSGIGYALEARTITSRILPSIFRESNVHPVLPFLRALRRTLLRLADDEPGAIGVLTPGAANETYSEHAYLARQMGLPLVEGEDLMVSNGRCWMLATDGRHPIRVLMRRLDDTFCDPLELNRQSVLGTPGVLQAVRNRQLYFANPLGTGVVENPGLMAYLPTICRNLLGEDLKLPSLQTWWCGQDLKAVRARFDDLIIRDIRKHTPPVATASLSSEERAGLWSRIRAEPGAYVAQAPGAHASAPVLTRQGVESRSVEMRTFAIADNDSFRVMSGGLARSGHDKHSWRVSGQLGGLCKDVWVLSSEPQRDAQILPQMLPVSPRPQQLNEPHVADNLLWLARYAIRAETLARLLTSTIKRLIERGPQPPDALAQSLCRALTWQTTLYPGFIGPLGTPNLEAPSPEIMRAISSDESGALRGTCQALTRSAYPVRNLLTTEIYALLSRLEEDLGNPDNLNAALAATELTGLRLAALNGYLLRSLPEGSPRHLIEIGFTLESALGTTRLLQSLSVDAGLITETGPLILDLVNSTTGFTDGGELSSQGSVLHILLLAETNPCSVRHQLMRLERSLRSLPGRRSIDGQRPVETLAAEKLVELGTLDLVSLLSGPDASNQLDNLLQQLHLWLRDVAQQVQNRYTPHRPPPATQLVRTA